MKYLFVYGAALTRDAAKAAIDASPLVKTWRYDMPNSFYLVSDFSAQKLYEDIAPRFAGKKRFLIAEINETNRQGLLPKDTWAFLNANNG